jgi:hypothetical protein
MLLKSCRGNQEAHFMFHKLFFFSENFVVYEIMWRNTLEPEMPQMTIWRILIACWITKDYRYTLRIFSTNCFSTTTVVARTSVYFMSQIHCPSCFLRLFVAIYTPSYLRILWWPLVSRPAALPNFLLLLIKIFQNCTLTTNTTAAFRLKIFLLSTP